MLPATSGSSFSPQIAQRHHCHPQNQGNVLLFFLKASIRGCLLKLTHQWFPRPYSLNDHQYQSFANYPCERLYHCTSQRKAEICYIFKIGDEWTLFLCGIAVLIPGFFHGPHSHLSVSYEDTDLNTATLMHNLNTLGGCLHWYICPFGSYQPLSLDSITFWHQNIDYTINQPITKALQATCHF